jgi:hypothetical protein
MPTGMRPRPASDRVLRVNSLERNDVTVTAWISSEQAVGTQDSSKCPRAEQYDYYPGDPKAPAYMHIS